MIIAEQQGVISELRQRVESLEARLSGDGPGARMPGHKPAARGKKGAGEAKRPLRKRRQGFARLRMEPTAQVTHAPKFCSECHTVLSGGWVQRTREVIELPVSPAEVTEHVFIARRCPLCRKRRLPRDPLREVAVGRQRLGINLVSLIAALREEGRLPIRTIQWYLRTVAATSWTTVAEELCTTWREMNSGCRGGKVRRLWRGMERVSVWARGCPVRVKFPVQRSPCCA